ncbi:hypothetical protein HMPREF1981_02765 [Bacteroides pyogenes F0041]|uniref:Uncharacterized protein n=1 Tax=Bacteroides pyogenes F0041 TaxID=1321819 RepID=U2BUV9_9BACE|nr:hypothetical protein HMPREF1981_02765 [Bacteroides pyogenes F0041]
MKPVRAAQTMPRRFTECFRIRYPGHIAPMPGLLRESFRRLI